MGTGIVSIALSLDGQETLSRLMLGIAGAAWLALVLFALSRIARRPGLLARRARSPGALTAVAATAVIAGRLPRLGWSGIALALLVLALGLWLLLLVPVLGSWRIPTSGTSLLLTVSTESLAAVAGVVATSRGIGWLAYPAAALLLLGLASYAFVMRSFDLRELGRGAGDQWITGGALAIGALAAGTTTMALRTTSAADPLAAPMRDLALVLWVLALAWLPVLVAAELARPRLRYDDRRWSTVFPIGMYAACSFVVGAAAGAGPLIDFARVSVWAGLAVWALVATGMLRNRLSRAGLRAGHRAGQPPDTSLFAAAPEGSTRIARWSSSSTGLPRRECG